MKLFITKYVEESNHYEATVMEKEACEKVLIDPFVGCAINIPESYSIEEDLTARKGLVGSIISIKDDTLFSKGIYLPSEHDIF